MPTPGLVTLGLGKSPTHSGNALDVAYGLFRNGARTIEHLPDERTLFETQPAAKGTAITQFER